MAESKFTVEEIEDLREAFDYYDLNQDGKIETSLIGSVMMCLGYVVTEGELQELLELVPTWKGQVDFKTFISIMERKDSKREIGEEVLNAFSVFDHENKGYLSGTDLRRLVERFGGNLNDLEVDDMVRQADTTGTNRIFYKQLLDEIMLSNKS